MKSILVTGGLGYIGSHTCVALHAAGFKLVIVDNLSNSKLSVLDRIVKLTGVDIPFVQADIRDTDALRAVFSRHVIDGVIHFAALKSVKESVEKPLDYYDVNVTGSLCLLRVMAEANVRTLVYSSSATVYGEPASVPIREDFPRRAINPYGRTKMILEDILADMSAADAGWRFARLRYFNPVGAHQSGTLGEDPSGIPANLMPYLLQVAVGRRPHLDIFGSDYPTRDGTGVRDYIHVMDLAEGHVAALRRLADDEGMLTLNLGTGQSVSVLELLHAFEQASQRRIPYRLVARREGDVAECWADPSLAAMQLGWRARRGLEEMCTDSWKWQSTNPNGYP
jgi:UDP-glucose 4-epimerase